MRSGSGVLHPPFPSPLAASSARAAPFSGERPSPSARAARWPRQETGCRALFSRAAACSRPPLPSALSRRLLPGSRSHSAPCRPLRTFRQRFDRPRPHALRPTSASAASFLRQGSGCRPPVRRCSLLPQRSAPATLPPPRFLLRQKQSSCTFPHQHAARRRSQRTRSLFLPSPPFKNRTRRPFCRSFTKRLRPSSGRNLRDMICGTQSGMRNHVPRARFTPYVQE